MAVTGYFRGVIKFVFPLGMLALSGCAQVQFNKEEDAWERAQVALRAGIASNELLACAGQPIRKTRIADGEKWTYGVTKQMDFASEFCNLTITLKQGRTVGFTRKSGNPGGFTDGSSVCAYVLDGCMGESIVSKNEWITGRVTRLTGDDDADDNPSDRPVGAAANPATLMQGVAGVQQQIANRKLQQATNQQQLNAQAEQRAVQAAATSRNNAIENAKNNAAYTAQLNAQRASQIAARPATQSGLATVAIVPPPMQTPMSPTPRPAGTGGMSGPAPNPTWTYTRDENVIIDYTRNDFDGAYSVYVTNTGNIRLLCSVTINGSYDPHAGGLHSDSSANSPFKQSQQNYLQPGTNFNFRFHSPGLNQVNSTSQSCTPA